MMAPHGSDGGALPGAEQGLVQIRLRLPGR
jgi:hypothetical protein